MSEKWHVVQEPVGENPSPDGKNMSGVVIYITDGVRKVEVSRVGFVRRNTVNKTIGFRRALKQQLDRAYDAVLSLNDLFEMTPADEEQKKRMMEEAVEKRERYIAELEKAPHELA
jgi:hypothetical protein